MVTITGNKNIDIFIAQILSNKLKPKSQLGFRKWTKKSSIFGKPNIVLKKSLYNHVCDHNALKTDWVSFYFVTIFFYVFTKMI
jgi:hypothetical protein